MTFGRRRSSSRSTSHYSTSSYHPSTQGHVACEPIIRISENIKKTFVEFRQELCGILQQQGKDSPK